MEEAIMKYDYKNRKIEFDSEQERIDAERHHANFGPGNGIGHPDDCEYCAQRGWKTWPGTNFYEECDRWAAEHPDEVETKE